MKKNLVKIKTQMNGFVVKVIIQFLESIQKEKMVPKDLNTILKKKYVEIIAKEVNAYLERTLEEF